MKKKLAIVGGGACALMLACELDPEKFEVSVYEKNSAPGRKFLVAGEGGLNLTHSEDPKAFITRYSPSSFLSEAFLHFSNRDFMDWLNVSGIPTFVGSSGRVFPEKGIKPIEVLNVFLERIKANRVSIHTKHTFIDFSAESLVFGSGDSRKEIKSDLIIFCMGGASWPVTGSAGDWADVFEEKKIGVSPFRASNCAFHLEWPADLLPKIEGRALKNIALSCGGKTHSGEIIVTRSGLEGSGIYPLSPQIRSQLDRYGQAEISLDLKPGISEETIFRKINVKPENRNITEHLKRELNLGTLHIHLLKHFLPRSEFLDAALLSARIKDLNVKITGIGPLEDAISTAGGVALEETDKYFQLNKFPSHFVIGEMLDYDAPTGGYLLQSCFSMAKYLADHLNRTHF